MEPVLNDGTDAIDGADGNDMAYVLRRHQRTRSVRTARRSHAFEACLGNDERLGNTRVPRHRFISSPTATLLEICHSQEQPQGRAVR